MHVLHIPSRFFLLLSPRGCPSTVRVAATAATTPTKTPGPRALPAQPGVPSPLPAPLSSGPSEAKPILVPLEGPSQHLIHCRGAASPPKLRTRQVPSPVHSMEPTPCPQGMGPPPAGTLPVHLGRPSPTGSPQQDQTLLPFCTPHLLFSLPRRVPCVPVSPQISQLPRCH